MSWNANLQLYHSDFRQLTERQIPSESVDLAFTDPPDNRDVYQDPARFGNKRLKHGGSLVTYMPQWAFFCCVGSFQLHEFQ
jgi:DNA modification methylase